MSMPSVLPPSADEELYDTAMHAGCEAKSSAETLSSVPSSSSDAPIPGNARNVLHLTCNLSSKDTKLFLLDSESIADGVGPQNLPPEIRKYIRDPQPASGKTLHLEKAGASNAYRWYRVSLRGVRPVRQPVQFIDDADELQTSETADESSDLDDSASMELAAASSIEQSASGISHDVTLATLLLIIHKDWSNLGMAYGFECWRSVLNPRSIRRDFGLRVACSTRIAGVTDAPIIKDVTKSKIRASARKRSSEVQESELTGIGGFDLDIGDIISSIRLLPVEPLGTSKRLLYAKSFLHFECSKKGQRFSDDLCEIADKAYTIYTTSPVRADLSLYLDIRVTDPAAIEALNEQLCTCWTDWYDAGLLYMSYEFWSYFQQIATIQAAEILASVRERGYEHEIKLSKTESLPASHFVNTVPQRLLHSEGSEFYYYQCGTWYQISRDCFDLLERKVQQASAKQADFSLPNFPSGSTREENYNESACEILQGNPDVKLALLLDKRNVPLGTTKRDFFEFADILVSLKNGTYWMIHVKKKDKNGDKFDHHRTQVERCPLYLDEHLNRSELACVIALATLGETSAPPRAIYRTLRKITAGAKKSTKATNVTFQALGNRIIAVMETAKGVKKENCGLPHAAQIWPKISASVSDPATYPTIQRFPAVTLICLNVINDHLSTEQAIEVFRRVEFALLAFAPLLEVGPLATETRERIKIVMAISVPNPEGHTFPNQWLWGMRQTQRIVEDRGFKFNYLFIKIDPAVVPGKKRSYAASESKSSESSTSKKRRADELDEL